MGRFTRVNPQSFNRDIVECKDARYELLRAVYASFNRDIVECKGLQAMEVAGGSYRFNRDIVECKGFTKVYFTTNIPF